MRAERPVSAQVDRVTGALDTPDNVFERWLSDMADMYEDATAARATLASSDPVKLVAAEGSGVFWLRGPLRLCGLCV